MKIGIGEEQAVADRTLVQVLYVDDNEDDLVLTQLACRHHHVPFQFTHVPSVGEAISRLKSAQANGCRPDLILVDLWMDHQTTFEVLEFVQADALLRQTPVVVFTGSSDPVLRQRANDLGAKCLLEKEPGLMVAKKLLAVAKELGLLPRPRPQSA